MIGLKVVVINFHFLPPYVSLCSQWFNFLLQRTQRDVERFYVSNPNF